jgi:hypothetical protein
MSHTIAVVWCTNMTSLRIQDITAITASYFDINLFHGFYVERLSLEVNQTYKRFSWKN